MCVCVLCVSGRTNLLARLLACKGAHKRARARTCTHAQGRQRLTVHAAGHVCFRSCIPHAAHRQAARAMRACVGMIKHTRARDCTPDNDPRRAQARTGRQRRTHSLRVHGHEDADDGQRHKRPRRRQYRQLLHPLVLTHGRGRQAAAPRAPQAAHERGPCGTAAAAAAAAAAAQWPARSGTATSPPPALAAQAWGWPWTWSSSMDVDSMDVE